MLEKADSVLHDQCSCVSLCCLQNPWKDHPRSIHPAQKPNYPAKFRQLFEGPDAPSGGYMWAPPKDPAMLDYKNAIITLIGRSPNLGEPLNQSWMSSEQDHREP